MKDKKEKMNIEDMVSEINKGIDEFNKYCEDNGINSKARNITVDDIKPASQAR